MIGVATHFQVASLPLAICQIMMVARIIDARPGDEMEVGVAIATPRGLWTHPGPAGYQMEQAGEYLLVTLREVPLTEAGAHRFALALGRQEVVVEVPVVVTSAAERRGVHRLLSPYV
jgi:hypothetical protein